MATPIMTQDEHEAGYFDTQSQIAKQKEAKAKAAALRKPRPPVMSKEEHDAGYADTQRMIKEGKY